MARGGRFAPPSGDQPSAHNAYSFAFHFDAGLYAAYLRDYAMQRGTGRIEGTIVDVELRPDDGFVAAVKLRDGRRIDGDLFIDCSGFRALLIGGAMKSPYEDWSAWLPCNSAQAVPCARVDPLTPYTTSTARAAGWQWRIPLQHRTGNGHVYCNAYTSDEEAARVLLENLDGPALDAPRQLRFTTGVRRAAWVKNVVGIGLSSGFLEPLESTSIQLIMDGVGRLAELFPGRDFKPGLAAEFNRKMVKQYESIRDFIILHYKITERSDSEFWRYCAAMSIPDTLAHQIELFRENSRVVILDKDSFSEPSWISMMYGLGLVPQGHDPFVDLVDGQALRTHFTRLREAIAGTVANMPSHNDYIDRHAKAAA
jgi:tryptophan halogenase